MEDRRVQDYCPARLQRKGSAMEDGYITLEIHYEGRGRLKYQLPGDLTDDQIVYFKTLVPRVEQGMLELVDPKTCQVIFSWRPKVTH